MVRCVGKYNPAGDGTLERLYTYQPLIQMDVGHNAERTAEQLRTHMVPLRQLLVDAGVPIGNHFTLNHYSGDGASLKPMTDYCPAFHEHREHALGSNLDGVFMCFVVI